MDRQALEQFAETGFRWFQHSGIGLDQIAEWCNEQSASTGDLRFWILGASFSGLDEWWASYDRTGGISSYNYLALDESITLFLGRVIDEPDPGQAAELAGLLSLRIQAVIDGRIPDTMYDHEEY